MAETAGRTEKPEDSAPQQAKSADATASSEEVGKRKEPGSPDTDAMTPVKKQRGEGTAAPADKEEHTRWFAVQNPLHLGLKLKIGSIYSEEDLLRRCREDKDKMSKLKECFSDRGLLKQVEAPPTSARPRSRAGGKRGASTGERTPTRRKSPLALPDSEKLKAQRRLAARRNLCVGQLVWDNSTKPPKAARITAIAAERDEPFLIRHFYGSRLPVDFKVGDQVSVDARRGEVIWDGRPTHPFIKVRWPDGVESNVIPVQQVQVKDDSADDEEVFVSELALQALDVDELLRNSPKASPATESEAPLRGDSSASSVGRPPARNAASQGLAVGQVAWASSSSRPPWPVKLLAESPEAAAGQQVWRVRLLGGADEEEEVPAANLVAFAAGDADAVAKAARIAEAEFSKTGAEAAAQAAAASA
eukprot:TRINITY_DN25330_c0_g1_i1.p1 TRINITY_DN25330_c0_g1~~TRINITY_DN25330_c0_g1_i1.p1  ORF type:complete len:418 (-),score=120.40 TRINITY_DN25330_c0_g1_i1:54-1307(-)